ncbi:Sugar phosphate exchanger 2-like [Oopsacas minuta]|uniref:Sugar phosphate exchanger 3 n=1 Tax=Oopsacas minuta TaxID=111878 RepID=A0AAV7JRR4_9METZ|nr:Sugar phosphate exchanger 2-like [Oopsacas minuta]
MSSNIIKEETKVSPEDPLIFLEKENANNFDFLSLPPLIEKSVSFQLSVKVKTRIYKASVWILTFICYTAFHLSRKSLSVVKSTLRDNCNDSEFNITYIESNTTCNHGWAPFNTQQGVTLLGVLDYSFLLTYAIAMFFSGAISDRSNLRCFLAFGTFASGGFMLLLGLAYFSRIHSIIYFIIVQIGNGIFQSMGHTGVFSANNHWFGKSKRGLILGIWNIHTPFGNILGSVIPGIWAGSDWGWSFFVPGFIMIIVAVLIFLFLVSDPSDVGLPQPKHHAVSFENTTAPPKAIGFCRALLIPGVVEYSACLFFNKLVSYTFLFWLPYFIRFSIQMNGSYLSAELSAFLSVTFDIGGIFGGIFAGFISDIFQSRSVICGVMLYSSIPSLFMYYRFGNTGIVANTVLQFVFGFMINGPYSLITTAISADLGTHESLKNSVNAKGTVVAIIDGIGSLGAATGPLLTGLLLNNLGYDWVIYLLISSCALAALVISRLIIIDLMRLCSSLKRISSQTLFHKMNLEKDPESDENFLQPERLHLDKEM